MEPTVNHLTTNHNRLPERRMGSDAILVVTSDVLLKVVSFVDDSDRNQLSNELVIVDAPISIAIRATM